MAILEEHCVLDVLTENILSECQPFTCGDEDMDEFFRRDALSYSRYRMGKSYCFRMKDNMQTIVACFTVSNDSIRIYDLPNSRRNAMWGLTHHEKILTRYPGVLLGRLAVSSGFSGKGVGSEVLDFVKMWFLDKRNKTGCRFAIVDAKNKKEILHFYERNGFKFLFPHEINEDLYTKPPKNEQEMKDRKQFPRILRTRLMFSDLLDD